jgi:peptidoglycan hydrolase CwlO-like protein
MPTTPKWIITIGTYLLGVAIVAFTTYLFTSSTTAQKTKDDIATLQTCSKELQERVRDLEKTVVYKEAWQAADEKYEKKFERIDEKQDKIYEKLDIMNDKISRLK